MKTKTKIYLAGSMAGGRKFEKNLELICNALEKLNCKVLTKDNVVRNELERKQPRTLRIRKEIMTRDKKWIRNSDLFIAEVSQYSHGVGFETCYAEVNKKPVLLLRDLILKSKTYSAFLDGSNYRKFQFSFYNSANIEKILKSFLNEYVK